MQTPEEAAGTYLFNEHVIKHHFCPTCGIHPYGEARDLNGNPVAAINIRCLEGIDLASVPALLTQTSRATKMVPLRLEISMSVTLTLKNIPEDVYRRLKLSAEMHRRSLNSEAIVCLEAVLVPNRLPPSERLARARALRGELRQSQFKALDIDAAKRQGRP